MFPCESPTARLISFGCFVSLDAEEEQIEVLVTEDGHAPLLYLM